MSENSVREKMFEFLYTTLGWNPKELKKRGKEFGLNDKQVADAWQVADVAWDSLHCYNSEPMEAINDALDNWFELEEEMEEGQG